ncbi:potassium channel family protein [Galbibacter pacificus]|uniref:Ion channel n=1 Tax=Galbibacter pacificus TaxID=2996052 RepID=A0ABT6FRU9_9FLAO|nr:potassium channel family protein [Galbibacter pacificus]MDG3582888.1 ion channel [Galbibacter pacificus]MDG3585993.1 ion channel [Galbibacter pacificus]
MLKKFYHITHTYKYEILLIALLAHLYIGIVLSDLTFYTAVIWPVNMLILGVASIGVFIEKGRIKKLIKNGLLGMVIALPISIPFFGHVQYFMTMLSAVYCLFFGFILIEILRFLIKPSYINTDIISASACGFFLLIEMAVFLLQAIFYLDNSTINNIDSSQAATIYMDLVYFSSITVTTIGFGDITPNTYSTKLIVSLMGVVSQFYTAVLIGILISKFVSQEQQNK